MKNTILVSQIVVSVALVCLILIQSRGSGLGRTFGASTTAFSRRGLERMLYKVTFLLAALFIIISIISLII